MLEGWLSTIVPILEKVFSPNFIRLEKEVMVILPGTCSSNVRWECCSFSMLTQGFPCRRNVIHVSSFEREEFLSRVISDLRVSEHVYLVGL